MSRLCLPDSALDFQVPEHIPAGRSVPAASSCAITSGSCPRFHPRRGDSRHRQPHYEIGCHFPLIVAGPRSTQSSTSEFLPRRGAYRRTASPLHLFPVRLPREDRPLGHPHTGNGRYPAVDPQPGFDDLLAGISGKSNPPIADSGPQLYQYAPTRPSRPRHVDWKASAHVGSLQIREFARELEQTSRFFWTAISPTNWTPGNTP